MNEGVHSTVVMREETLEQVVEEFRCWERLVDIVQPFGLTAAQYHGQELVSGGPVQVLPQATFGDDDLGLGGTIGSSHDGKVFNLGATVVLLCRMPHAERRSLVGFGPKRDVALWPARSNPLGNLPW